MTHDEKLPHDSTDCKPSTHPTTVGPGNVGRRQFLAVAGVALGMSLLDRPVMAGPFDETDWDQIIPADKKLNADWVRSLFARGEPTVYAKSSDELNFIGMPVGGICCGTMYLSGDGRLWNWDIFNQQIEGVLPRFLKWSDIGMEFDTGDRSIRPRDGATYVKPAVPADSPSIAQGFAIQIHHPQGTTVRRLDATAWADVQFRGQYPIGTVDYADPGSQISVTLEAFSPFVPHNADDSGLPATIFEFSVTNRGTVSTMVELAGWLQNATCFYSARAGDGRRVNRIVDAESTKIVEMLFEPAPMTNDPSRPDIVVEDFEHGYDAWVRDGNAFGSQPVDRRDVPAYQGDLGGSGQRVVNSHTSAPGADIGEKDNQTGKLTSRPFLIQRNYLQFFVGGGRRGDVGVRLRVGGRVVRSAHGLDANSMRRDAFDVTEFQGQEGTIEIYDDATGPWANVGADEFVLTDRPQIGLPLVQRLDFGSMALAVVGNGEVRAAIDAEQLPESAFAAASAASRATDAPVGVVTQRLQIEPGKSSRATFLLAWHFPNTNVPCPDAKSGNYYAHRFQDAKAVVSYVAAHWSRLSSLTRLWRDTWYDSTLPHWFLERTFVNTSTLATTTAHRFATGRFWAWEGIGCCAGTCTHVWHYAQAVGRIFPEIERDQRERVDFGVGFIADQGVVRHRAEGTGPAIDGQCGRILGVWREHQMSADATFLRRVWPNVKRALEYIIRHDRDGDGILDGAQENTLDAAWYGQIAWITSLAIAALRAGERMAIEQGDEPFATQCRQQYEKARRAVESTLFNGEFFIQIADPLREKSLGTYEACHIDQVHGQSWAWQVDLGEILDRDKRLSALRALWKYNFAPDVGPFRQRYTAGRPYALAGDAGLVMATNPKRIKEVYGLPSWQIGYFNECMSGFEHQVASHMMAEGMTLESLAITRAIHDRYHARRRNPFNEIECSDHYARAMASYGTFVSACGFRCHGPSGQIGFAPKLTPENFKAPFTIAEGWGSYLQQYLDGKQLHSVELKYGQARVKRVSLEVRAAATVTRAEASLPGMTLPLSFQQDGRRLTLTFAEDVQLRPGMSLDVVLHLTS